jgi:fused signal recognition particle receptor
MGIFSKFKAGLKKTKDSMINKMHRVVNSFTKIDEELFEQLEETMIMSDIGVETSLEICSRLRKKIKEQGVTDPALIMDLIQEIVAEMMGDDTSLNMSTTPSIIMVIGVNGAGKTTTIGKLCHQLKSEGKKVIVAAADTFRAAAIDQLQVWTERAGVDIVKHAEGSDPGAVVYDAIQAAKARNCDVLIIDTAGRLHNKKNLMEELAKINRIMSTQAEGCSKEVLLVLDATTGQNAVNQARLFSETAELTGIVLTKLDGTAKGGIVISIMNELNIPVKLVGVGEQIDDLQPFDSKSFVAALFEDNDAESEEAETTESDEISENETAEIEAEEATEYTEETSDETETAEEIETENYTDTVTESETEIETEISDTEEAEAEESVSENTEEAAEVTEEEEKTEETEKSKKKGFFSKFFRGDK